MCAFGLYTTMNMLIMSLNCATLLLGLLVCFGSTVKAECQKKRFEIKSLCQTKASYGTVLGDYTTSAVSRCSAFCTSSCKSFTYDAITGRCITNSLALADVPTCDINVKYGQTEQCVFSGQTKICSPDLYAVPGQIRGYLLVNIFGEWGTVCDDHWDETISGASNAYVVCRSLGYRQIHFHIDRADKCSFGLRNDSSHGGPVYPLQHPQYYEGQILMDNIECYGYETSVLQCLNDPDASDCVHMEDIQVICVE